MEVTDELIDQLEKIRNDPWEFLKLVRTKDQVDKLRPIKPYPVHLEYLRLYVRLWQRENKIAVPKSRRMLMSWTNISLFTWDALFHRNRDFAFVSKKEEDAADLVDRAQFIIDNLDITQFPKELIPRYQKKFGALYIPDLDSKIRGFPQGEDQLRQYTFSGLLFDECAFWEKAEQSFSASLPTIDSVSEGGGGRIVMLSSPAPGFFKRLVHDELDRDPEKGSLLV